MLAEALYTVTINKIDYKKWETYDIEKQINIAGKDYFKILKEEKKSKNKKVEDKKVEEVLVEKKENKKVEENFDNLAK